MSRVIGGSRGRLYIYVNDVPLVGHIAFGVVDRGTNILQVRPTTICPYNCIFCSVDAGPRSRYRQAEFIVDWKHLVKWVKHVVEAKGDDVLEVLIDGVGEPPTHPNIINIVAELKKLVPRVAMESRGMTLTKSLINALDKAGLDRLNISIDTLNTEKGIFLQGVPWYRVDVVKEIVEHIVKETNIDVHLTPVWIPGINDKDIEEIIEWGLKIGVGKRFPPFGIQKYEVHKYGRRVPGVKEPTWREFKEFLEKLEKKFGIPLYYKKLDFGFKYTKRYPIKYSRGEHLYVTIAMPGWLRNEVIAVDTNFETLITVVGMKWRREAVGKKIKVVVLENQDGIYIAKPL
jgi:uncharacterized Fe-S cluster-containing radical SAM superfamily enzyme